MDNPVSTVFIDINVDNETIRAAVCQRCGAKIHPPRLLRLHLDYHQVKDMFLTGELKKLQSAMEKMK